MHDRTALVSPRPRHHRVVAATWAAVALSVALVLAGAPLHAAEDLSPLGRPRAEPGASAPAVSGRPSLIDSTARPHRWLSTDQAARHLPPAGPLPARQLRPVDCRGEGAARGPNRCDDWRAALRRAPPGWT